MMTTNKRYAPIVIVGGGVVGATTALLLAKNWQAVNTTPATESKQHQPLQILLIDAAQPKPIAEDKHNSRVFALSLASIRLLKHVHVWQHIKRTADYTGMQVWSTNGAGELSFGQVDDSSTTFANKQSLNNTSANNTILGSMVEPDVLHDALHQKLEETSVITTLYHTKVVHAENIANSYLANTLLFDAKPKWQLSLSNGDVVLTPLVIAADGRGSFMRQQAGIDLETLDYKKTAICCALNTQKPHGNIARQVFLPTGPLALLPLADINVSKTRLKNPEKITKEPSNKASEKSTDIKAGCWQSIVWTLPTNMALDILAQPSNVLAKKIASASEYTLGDATQITSVASFPLKAQHASTYVNDGLVLIGDAAHGVHPLAGQGLNLGMLDAAILTEKLLADSERSRAMVWGHLHTLQRYEQERRAHNAAMMHAFSLIGWLFSGQNYPGGHVIEWLRSEGVLGVSKLPLLMDWFGKQAGGVDQLANTRWHAPVMSEAINQ